VGVEKHGMYKEKGTKHMAPSCLHMPMANSHGMTQTIMAERDAK
jgi:hypothetical protein